MRHAPLETQLPLGTRYTKTIGTATTRPASPPRVAG